MSKSNKDNNGDGYLFVIGLCFVIYFIVYVVAFVIAWVVNSLAFIISASGFWIGQLGTWPMQFLHAIGIVNIHSSNSAAITQALGWFAFFSIIGSIGAALIAHATLPTETPKIAYEEDKISRWISVKIFVCIVIFLIFVYILWKY
jgi:hypothetical protein